VYGIDGERTSRSSSSGTSQATTEPPVRVGNNAYDSASTTCGIVHRVRYLYTKSRDYLAERDGRSSSARSNTRWHTGAHRMRHVGGAWRAEAFHLVEGDVLVAADRGAV